MASKDTVIYLALTGGIFGIVALGHLSRALAGWALRVGPVDIPFWVSWAAVVITATLCVWAFRLTTR